MSDGSQRASGTEKFLIVDDHAAFRQTIRPFLPNGSVIECGDGNQALDACAAERPDWVLMDIEMPGMDGLTATRELKRRFPDVRVIIITNHGEEDMRTAALELGAVGFVRKEHLEDLKPLLMSQDRAKRM